MLEQEATFRNPDSEPIKRVDPSDMIVVGIGASAGGIAALKEFFQHVSKGSDMAYVVILHLSPEHDSKLAEILQLVSPIPVEQVRSTTKINRNHVYVVPPNQHLTIVDNHIEVNQNTATEDRRAPVDIFFRTLAESYGQAAVCVILSGSGANGSMGLKRIKERGGAVFVQNPREAEYNEMPRHAIATDLVDDVLSASQLPDKILAYKSGLSQIEIPIEPEKRAEEQQQALREVFMQLRMKTGHDFSNYKRPTILRRIERRISMRNLNGLPAYAQFLNQNIDEVTFLLKDLLISVTNFYRDKAAFDVLQTEIIPKIISGKNSEQTIRIWVAGCATGEEAYSIAMLFAEQTLNTIDAPKIQIFATDIDDDAIAHAREGYYTINDAADVQPDRLQRFFSREGEGFRIRREIREMILFANHNFVKDPPFSHLHLVSCRNVLIYLNRTAQERVLETFHFALDPGGYLLLGSSESVEGSGDLYMAVNRDQHIFQSRPISTKSYPVPESIPTFRFNHHPRETNPITENKNISIERVSFGDLHQLLLEEYAPPSLIINEEYDIVHLTERVGKYLQVGGGELSKNLLKLILPDLRLELRSALYQASQKRTSVEARELKVNIGDRIEIINILVRPVWKESDINRGFMLVLFDQTAGGLIPDVHNSLDEPVARHLEDELIRIKSQLRSSVEQHEFHAEELKATNEELQAMNEELRSSAEELETSKEELQSINEELRTVNQELKIKIEETTLTSNNLQNLINSVDIGTIFLDRSFRVALFTPAARKIFNLLNGDHGRPLSDITHNLEYFQVLSDAESVLDKLTVVEREVHSKDGNIFMMRIFPYRTAEDRINGVVLTFFDITEHKTAEHALRLSEDRYRTLFTSIDEAFALCEIIPNPAGGVNDFNIIDVNPAFIKILGINPAFETGKSARQLLPFIEDWWVDIYTTVAKERRAIRFEKMIAETERWFDVYACPIDSPERGRFALLLSDITQRKKNEQQLREHTGRLRLATDVAKMYAWEYNLKTQSVWYSDNIETIAGYRPGAGFQDFLQLIFAEDRDKFVRTLQQAVEGGEEFSIDVRNSVTLQEKIWYRITARVTRDDNGNAHHVIGVSQDITQRKTLEEEKDEFIGIASHELKTPVTSILAFTELLLEKIESSNDDSQLSLVQKLNGQLLRLNSLINDLLDTTSISEGKVAFKLEKLDLNTLILDQVEDLQRLYARNQIITHLRDIPRVVADRERIKQVLINLISNATKYSSPGQKIEISSEVEGDFAKVKIKDAGIGMSADTQQKIFQRFFRIGRVEPTKTAGLGLGLYISSEIIKRHKGEIGVRSNIGDGSEFYFTLPLA